MSNKNISVMKDAVEADSLFSEGKKEWSSILDAVSDWICLLDKNHRIIRTNIAVKKITGLSPSEVIGQVCCKITHGSDKPLPGCPLEKMLLSRKRESLEIQIPDSDRWLKVTVDPVKDEKENVIGAVHIVSDITERKKAEAAIKYLKEYNENILESNPNPIIIVKGNQVEYVNNSFISAFGKNKDDYISKDLKEVIPVEVIPAFEELLQEYDKIKELEAKGKSFSVSSFVIKKAEAEEEEEEEEEEKRIGLILQDITERKRAEMELVRLSNAVKMSMDSIVISDMDAKIIDVNDATLKMYGTDNKKDLIGKNPFDLIAPEDQEKALAGAKETLKKGYVKGREYNIITKDGSKVPVEMSVAIMKDANGKPIGFVGTSRDITERKKAEKAVRESEKKYRRFLENLADGCFVIDREWRYIFVNDAACQLVKPTRDELLGNKITELFPGIEKTSFFQTYKNTMETGKTNKLEACFPRPDGTPGYYNVHVSAVPEGICVISTDITERKKAEEKIKQQNIQLKKLDRIKTDFLNITSHELRTPMASIKGYIQMLLKQTLGNVTPEQKDALNVVLRNTNRLNSLVEEILDISQLESGTMKFIPEKTDITKMIKEVAETMQSSANLKNIKINTELEEIPELVIDQERIKQILMNLVDNSIKFSPHDSTINLCTKMKKDDVLFEVQDFGRGIPKKKQKKIFERFYQVDAGMDRKFGGVGLGLAISQGIVNAHGGRIWGDSTLGNGSSFKFSLPLQSVKDAEDRFKKEVDVFELEK